MTKEVWISRLEANIEILRNCEQTLWYGDSKLKDGARRMKVFAMAEISILNRKIYSK